MARADLSECFVLYDTYRGVKVEVVPATDTSTPKYVPLLYPTLEDAEAALVGLAICGQVTNDFVPVRVRDLSPDTQRHVAGLLARAQEARVV